MVMDCLLIDAVTFSQSSVVVSCDWSLAKLRLRSGGGGGRFASFNCIWNFHLSSRWSEYTMFSVTNASLTMQSLSLFVMMWSNCWGDFERGCIHVPWIFLEKSGGCGEAPDWQDGVYYSTCLISMWYSKRTEYISRIFTHARVPVRASKYWVVCFTQFESYTVIIKKDVHASSESTPMGA